MGWGFRRRASSCAARAFRVLLSALGHSQGLRHHALPEAGLARAPWTLPCAVFSSLSPASPPPSPRLPAVCPGARGFAGCPAGTWVSHSLLASAAERTPKSASYKTPCGCVFGSVTRGDTRRLKDPGEKEEPSVTCQCPHPSSRLLDAPFKHQRALSCHQACRPFLLLFKNITGTFFCLVFSGFICYQQLLGFTNRHVVTLRFSLNPGRKHRGARGC